MKQSGSKSAMALGRCIWAQELLASSNESTAKATLQNKARFQEFDEWFSRFSGRDVSGSRRMCFPDVVTCLFPDVDCFFARSVLHVFLFARFVLQMCGHPLIDPDMARNVSK